MTLAISIVMIVVAAAFVAAPFFAGAAILEPVEAAPRGQIERQKRDAYAAIKEAEFDYQMGKLSADDFNVTRERYAAQALAAISALESRQAPSHHRAKVRRPTRIAFCPSCGHAVPPRANFCSACGLSLKEAVALRA